MVGTEGLDEFDVFCFGVGLYEDTKMGLTFIEGFCAFAKTTGETVVVQGVFEY